MKKAFLLFFTAISSLAFGQTATNFSVNDCSVANHDLFTELDAGKVVVMCWVMPCSSCIATAANDANIAQSYASSYPGRVVFYLIDDSGNTPCSSLTSWASANGIAPDASFSNGAISMYDYGGPGMPKTVVLGGSSHSVFYNVNGAIDSHNIQLAINSALAATGVQENNSAISAAQIFPNPCQAAALHVNFELMHSSNVNIELVNIFGQTIQAYSMEKMAAGKQEAAFDFSAEANGVYFIRLSAAGTTQTLKFILAD